MTQAFAIDPSRCPICGQANRCAMEIERETGARQPPCWCTQVDFNRAVLERIPAEARRLACVCQACATTVQPTIQQGETQCPPTTSK